jgi:signal transduction histidine kinase/CheY-like chemotaxis protein
MFKQGAILKQNLRLVLKVFDALPLYGILFNGNGTVKTVNKAFAEAVALSRENIEGMTLDELEPYYTGIKEQFADLQIHESRTFRGQLVTTWNQAILVEQTLVHVEDNGSTLIASIGHDISNMIREQELRYEYEDELRKAEQRLESANRMRSKFIANMNHEIRTPMNAIIGYAEMLSSSDLDKREQRFVTTILKNGSSLLSILNDVMELSKLEAGRVTIQKSTTRLQAIIEQVIDLYSDQLQAKHLTFNATIAEDLPESYIIDEAHCRQILSNLISNAVKFTSQGTISITVDGEQKEADLYLLSFKITDTGVGIDKAQQQAILNIFRQHGKNINSQQGKRFGLTLCARLARMMDGEILLDSTPGTGSTFTFNIPARKSRHFRKNSNARTQTPKRVAAGTKQPTLLVVDDMPVMSNLIKVYFVKSPIKVLVADTPDECMTMAEEQDPDLILMDLNLGEEDGRDVAQRLRNNKKTAHIPIVVMTGLMLVESEYKPLFDDFLAKPFHLHELQRMADIYISLPEDPPVESVNGDNQSVQGQDIDAVQSSWNQELDTLLKNAQLTGSLDDAFLLGQKMADRGAELEVEQLQEMGKLLQEYAVDPDILGVEQILGNLQRITGERK